MDLIANNSKPKSKSKTKKRKTLKQKESINSNNNNNNNNSNNKVNNKLINNSSNDLRENTNKSVGQRKESDNHLITDYFRNVSSTRKRLTTKALEFQSELLIRHYISNKCDPIDSLTVQEFEDKGKGVIASKLINKGSFICEYSGDLVDIREAKLREEKYESLGAGCYMYYFKWLNNVWCVDATKPTGRFGRLINHSRKAPNCKSKIFVHNERPHLIFIALRNIEQNEEILYDYGERDKYAIEANPWLNST